VTGAGGRGGWSPVAQTSSVTSRVRDPRTPTVIAHA